nr:MAG TPA: hypothetical protein [Caudoviricetes sp.]
MRFYPYQKPSFLVLRVRQKPSFLTFSCQFLHFQLLVVLTFTWLRNHFFPVSYPLWHGFIPTLAWFRNTDF